MKILTKQQRVSSEGLDRGAGGQELDYSRSSRGSGGRSEEKGRGHSTKVRKQFAEDKQTKDVDYWNHVLWTDETKINLFGSDGVKRVAATRLGGTLSHLHYVCGKGSASPCKTCSAPDCQQVSPFIHSSAAVLPFSSEPSAHAPSTESFRGDKWRNSLLSPPPAPAVCFSRSSAYGTRTARAPDNG
ncbi:hypothetical protein NFI96_012035 [Prochilodus magdalenae]|nr:hypothetical protein NFI96_012035 [Prochilodus magdalenae]